MSDFWLKKWYLDAADRCGNAYFGYWVVIRWQGLTLHYYQHLWHTVTHGVISKAGFSRQPEPAWHSDTDLCWHTQDVRASWHCQKRASIAETVLENNQGRITWQCLQPKALVELESSSLTFTAWGYTEYIEVALPPWQLPWQTLYWGRAHSDQHYMVWIKWDGPTAQSLLWHDAKRTADLAISETSISSPEIELKVENASTLRQGVIGSTLFRSFEKLTALFPKSALLINEHKQYGTGQIVTEDTSEPASIIFERVLW